MSISQKLKSLGSSPRSSEGIYKKASDKAESIADAASSIFSSKEEAKKASITDNKLRVRKPPRRLTALQAKHQPR